MDTRLNSSFKGDVPINPHHSNTNAGKALPPLPQPKKIAKKPLPLTPPQRIKNATQNVFENVDLKAPVNLNHSFSSLSMKLENEFNLFELVDLPPPTQTVTSVKDMSSDSNYLGDKATSYENPGTIDEIIAGLSQEPKELADGNQTQSRESVPINQNYPLVRSNSLSEIRKSINEWKFNPLEIPTITALSIELSKNKEKLEKSYSFQGKDLKNIIIEKGQELSATNLFPIAQQNDPQIPVKEPSLEEIDNLLADVFNKPQTSKQKPVAPPIDHAKPDTPPDKTQGDRPATDTFQVGMNIMDSTPDSQLQKLEEAIQKLGKKNKLVYIADRGFITTERLSKLPLIKKWMKTVQSAVEKSPISSKSSITNIGALSEIIVRDGNYDQAVKLKIYIDSILKSSWGKALPKDERNILKNAGDKLMTLSPKVLESPPIPLSVAVPSIKTSESWTTILRDTPEAFFTATQATEYINKALKIIENVSNPDHSKYNPQEANSMMKNLLKMSLNSALVYRTRNLSSYSSSLPPDLAVSLHEVAKKAQALGLNDAQMLLELLYPREIVLTREVQDFPIQSHSIFDEAVKNRTLDRMDKVRQGTITSEEREELLYAAVSDASKAATHYLKQIDTLNFNGIIDDGLVTIRNSPTICAAIYASESVSATFSSLLNEVQFNSDLTPEERLKQLNHTLEFTIELLSDCFINRNYFVTESLISSLMPFSAEIESLAAADHFKEIAALFTSDNNDLIKIMLENDHNKVRYPLPPINWLLRELEDLTKSKPPQTNIEWGKTYLEFYSLFDTIKNSLGQVNFPMSFDSLFFRPLVNLSKEDAYPWKLDEPIILPDADNPEKRRGILEPVTGNSAELELMNIRNSNALNLLRSEMDQSQAELTLRRQAKTNVAILRNDPVTQINWISIKEADGNIVHRLFNPNYESIIDLSNYFKNHHDISFIWKASAKKASLENCPYVHKGLSEDQVKELLEESMENSSVAIISYSEEKNTFILSAKNPLAQTYTHPLPNEYKSNQDIVRLKNKLEANGITLLEAPPRLETTSEKIRAQPKDFFTT